MKKISTAIAVLAIVCGALAFKAHHYSQATIYCFDPNAVVTTTEACTAVGQPASDHIGFVVDPTGLPINPCAGQTDGRTKAFVNTATSCTNTAGLKYKSQSDL